MKAFPNEFPNYPNENWRFSMLVRFCGIFRTGCSDEAASAGAGGVKGKTAAASGLRGAEIFKSGMKAQSRAVTAGERSRS